MIQVAGDIPTVTQRERELGAIIGAYNEVTERLKGAHEMLHREVARLHEELRRKNEALRRRERLAALGEMAAGLAHEIRNPLGGIALYASMLEQELSSHAKARTAATRISTGVKSLERLVSEILDFAQEQRLDRRQCRLGVVLHEVAEAVARCAAQCGASVEIAPEAHGVEVEVDTGRLQRVLVNLVMNGLQACRAGGCVRVTAHGGAEAAVIEVTDSGPGIPEAHLHRIFNPFFTTKDTGTGLGLAIVHQIIEAHGGTIRASNGPGGGALFVIRLPRREEPAGAPGSVDCKGRNEGM